MLLPVSALKDLRKARVASNFAVFRRSRGCANWKALRPALLGTFILIPLVLLVVLFSVDASQLKASDEPAPPGGTAAAATAPPVPVNTYAASARSRPALPHTFGGVHIPSTWGAYNLSAACSASVRFLSKMSAQTGTPFLTKAGDAHTGQLVTAHHEVHPRQRLYQAIKETRNPVTNTLVIAYVSVQQYRIALNWLANLRRVQVTNVLILALDGMTASVMNIDAVDGVRVLSLTEASELDPELVPLHKLRFHVLTYALCTGVNVIMSDIDAVWLRNPIAEHMLSSPNDCVFSGDDSPTELLQSWTMSSTASFCLFYCQSNERTISLAAAGQRHLDTGSLTDALNYGLNELGIDVDRLPPLPEQIDPAQQAALNHARNFYGFTYQPVALTFTMLSRAVVTRNCGVAFHGTTWAGSVAHCTAQNIETPADKETLLRMKGLWRLEATSSPAAR